MIETNRIDGTGGASTRAPNTEQDILRSLTLVKDYYCDVGTHAGRQKVTLDGYLTQEQFSRLVHLMVDSGLSSESVDILTGKSDETRPAKERKDDH